MEVTAKTKKGTKNSTVDIANQSFFLAACMVPRRKPKQSRHGIISAILPGIPPLNAIHVIGDNFGIQVLCEENI
jgi:hypothetical protein